MDAEALAGRRVPDLRRLGAEAGRPPIPPAVTMKPGSQRIGGRLSALLLDALLVHLRRGVFCRCFRRLTSGCEWSESAGGAGVCAVLIRVRVSRGR